MTRIVCRECSKPISKRAAAGFQPLCDSAAPTHSAKRGSAMNFRQSVLRAGLVGLVVALTSCGGGGGADTSTASVNPPPCSFDVKPFLNGTQASQPTSVWHCSAASVVPDFDFVAFEDGNGYSSGIGNFRWAQSACGSISVDGTVPQTISKIQINQSTRTVAFLATQANGAVSTTCSLEKSTPNLYQNHAVTYDSARQRSVVFGGNLSLKSTVGGQSNLLRIPATFEYDGVNWRTVSTTVSPAFNIGQNMVFDKSRNVAVLVTTPSGGATSETWEFSGAAWSRSATLHSPPGRRDHLMAFDARRGVTVLFSGTGTNFNPFYDDTWEYDGIDWTQKAICPGDCPIGSRPYVAPNSMSMNYYPDAGFSVVYGNGPSSTETWSWNGAVWSRLSIGGPGSLSFPSMAYDATRHRIVLSMPFIWEWDGAAWSTKSAGTSWPYGLGTPIVYDENNAVVLIFSSPSNVIKWDGTTFSP